MEQPAHALQQVIKDLTDVIRGDRKLDEISFHRMRNQIDESYKDEWREYAYALLATSVAKEDEALKHFTNSMKLAPHEAVAYNYLLCLKRYAPHHEHISESLQLGLEFKSVRIMNQAYKGSIEILDFEKAENIVGLCGQFSPDAGDRMRNDINEMRSDMEKFMAYGNLTASDVHDIAHDMVEVANTNGARIVFSQFMQMKEHGVNAYTLYVSGISTETMADMQFQLADKLAERDNLSPVNFSAGYMDGEHLERSYASK
ncbi:hypothetical protein DV583_09190 [Salmonella enterica]|nr:hypothetical protein [Salmonella enterica]EDH8505955.1 hypothetical protein [Salmonella enterica subsp. enterica serovar Montevideo]ECJ2213994.1 hypothetical protein [Salmonella enterica]EFT6751817.1 hypothetical protein [Salmonella enterica]EGL0604084.1 hypothetical protein [Salmonella enterica]